MTYSIIFYNLDFIILMSVTIVSYNDSMRGVFHVVHFVALLECFSIMIRHIISLSEKMHWIF